METQQDKIKMYCKSMDLKVRKVYKDEGISGKRRDNRPGLLRCLKAIKKGDILIVYSLSRLSRSIRETLAIFDEVKGCGADIVSVSDSIDTRNPFGKMLLQLMAVIAEAESDNIAERVKAGMQTKKKKGEVVSRPRYGWMKDPANKKGLDFVPNEEEQEVILFVKSHRDNNIGRPTPYAKIGHMLMEAGYRPRDAKMWYPMQVRSIYLCESPVIKGRTDRQ